MKVIYHHKLVIIILGELLASAEPNKIMSASARGRKREAALHRKSGPPWIGLPPQEDEAHSKCPPGTYPHHHVPREGTDVHCICPLAFQCNGCTPGCLMNNVLNGSSHFFGPSYMTGDDEAGCTRGFSSGCGDECNCKAPKSLPRLGLHILDRRRESLCPHRPFGAKASELLPDLPENYTFIFVVSTGHTGTTSLGQRSTWRQQFRRKTMPCDFFVAHEKEQDRHFVHQTPWTTNPCAAADRYVLRDKLPLMIRMIEGYKRDNGCTVQGGSWFGSGHQVTLGLLPSLAWLLGPRARFVRLRRDRLDTAYSFSSAKAGPCSVRCKHCLCPLDNATMLPVSGKVWQTLSNFQQYLWLQDEVEAQWQSLLYNNPTLNFIEVNWKKRLGVEDYSRIAQFALGLDRDAKVSVRLANANHHVSGAIKAAKNRTIMAQEAVSYARTLGLKCNEFHCMPPL